LKKGPVASGSTLGVAILATLSLILDLPRHPWLNWQVCGASLRRPGLVSNGAWAACRERSACVS